MLGSNIVLLWDKKFCKITTKFGSILQQATAFLRLSILHFKYNCYTTAENISLAGYFSRENRKDLFSTQIQKVFAMSM